MEASRERCSQVALAWCIEFLTGFVFYTIFLGWFMSHHGVRNSIPILLNVQILISVAMIIGYDLVGKDFFAIEAAKEVLETKVSLAKWKLIPYILMVTQCQPAMTTLCLRHKGSKWINVRTGLLLLMAIVVKSLYMGYVQYKFNPFFTIDW